MRRAERPEIKSVRQHLHDARGMAPPSVCATQRSLDETFTASFDVTADGIRRMPLGIATPIDLDKLVEFVVRLEVVMGRQVPGHVTHCGTLPVEKERRYVANLPLVETHEEAQLFRLGPDVAEHGPPVARDHPPSPGAQDPDGRPGRGAHAVTPGG